MVKYNLLYSRNVVTKLRLHSISYQQNSIDFLSDVCQVTEQLKEVIVRLFQVILNKILVQVYL